MAFIGVEFTKEEDGGGLGIVHYKWLTPRKSECFWPPFKTQTKYEKVLKQGTSPDEQQWKLYKVHRVFFECDDLDKAREKLKKAEVTSDLQSDNDIEEVVERGKRKCFAPRRLYDSGPDSSDTEESVLPSPPPVIVPKRKRTTSSLIDRIFDRKTPPPSSPQLSSAETISVQSVSSNASSSQLFGSTSSKDSNPLGLELGLLRTVNYIKEQNTEILGILKKTPVPSPSSTFSLSGLPTELPAVSEENLKSLEKFLETEDNLNNFVIMLHCKDVVSQTNNCLRRVLSNKLACSYSFFGKRGEKKPFSSLKFKKCLVAAILKNIPHSKEKEVEDSIKNWLKHSPQRYRNECLKLDKYN
ncbi:unnamed protein product [Brassicogethes aeneus]|uniref:DUF4806 domain-containing protein n=1 Tax=Brassicogethes aeneus TaxID=1431903 RepID=A0A9P0ARF7_BRAAE|nr:unnamed protein product [Brassicogethes aeneus]